MFSFCLQNVPKGTFSLPLKARTINSQVQREESACQQTTLGLFYSIIYLPQNSTSAFKMILMMTKRIVVFEKLLGVLS